MPSTEAAVAAPRRDGRRTDTRERLVVAALRMFNEKGYARTTVAEIERAVGLRPGGGGLYRHFSSKDELLLEAVHGYHDRVRALRAELAERADRGARSKVRPERQLADEVRQLVGALAEFLAGEGPMVRLSLDAGGLPDPVRHAVGDAWDDGYGMLVDLLGRHGVDEVHATTIAVSTLGALNHYFTAIGIWRQAPAGVTAADFLEAWIDQVCVLGSHATR